MCKGSRETDEGGGRATDGWIVGLWLVKERNIQETERQGREREGGIMDLYLVSETRKGKQQREREKQPAKQRERVQMNH